MSDRIIEMLEEENKFLREEVRLLRIAQGEQLERRRIEMPQPDEVDAAKVVVYEDRAGEWRWMARDTNGAKVADSGEGYVERRDAVSAAQDLFPEAEILQLHGE